MTMSAPFHRRATWFPSENLKVASARYLRTFRNLGWRQGLLPSVFLTHRHIMAGTRRICKTKRWPKAGALRKSNNSCTDSSNKPSGSGIAAMRGDNHGKLCSKRGSLTLENTLHFSAFKTLLSLLKHQTMTICPKRCAKCDKGNTVCLANKYTYVHDILSNI